MITELQVIAALGAVAADHEELEDTLLDLVRHQKFAATLAEILNDPLYAAMGVRT